MKELDNIKYLEYNKGYIVHYNNGSQKSVDRSEGERLLFLIVEKYRFNSTEKLINSGLLKVGDQEDLEDIMSILGEEVSSVSDQDEKEDNKFEYISLRSNQAGFVYGELVYKNQSSVEITSYEVIEILVDYAKENHIKYAHDLLKTDILEIYDYPAKEIFDKKIAPIIQERINLFEIEKIYIYENGEKGNCYIQYKDGTIEEKTREDMIKELIRYGQRNNLSREKMHKIDLFEQIDEEEAKKLSEQIKTDDENTDENTFNIEKIYIYYKTNSKDPEEPEELRGIVCYKDGTKKDKSQLELEEDVTECMKKYAVDSIEELEDLGVIEEIDEKEAKKLFEQIKPDDENTFNIEKIYTYYKTNSKDPEEPEELRGIVCYKDGTKEDKAKPELKKDVISCMEKYAVDSIGELEDLGVIEEISEKQAGSILKENIEIGKIVFVSYITDNKEIETRAIIYYTNGKVKEVNREEAEKEILNIKKANNIKETEQLFEEKFLECTTISEWNKDHPNYIEQAKSNKGKYSSSKKKPNIFKRIWKKLKTNKLVRWISIGLATLSVLGTASCTYNLVHKSIDGNIKNENNQDDNMISADDAVIDNIAREDFSVYSYDELIQRCKTNKARQEAMQTIYNFITDYNLNTSYTYKEEKSSAKLSHTVDEVSAMYLLYNDINPETVNEIYQSTTLDTKQLRKDLINAQKQDSLAHNIQTRTINKDKLFTDSKAKKFYNKYEEIFIKMNDTSNYNKKTEYKKKFYDMVRSDLSGMASNSYENVDSSKIIIKEFVDAMRRVKIDVDNKLTDQEMKYINGILENVVDKKIKDIVTKQSARNMVATVDITGEIVDTNPYYSEFKDAIVKELEAKDSYYTTDDNRDIRDYKKFKKNTKPKQYEKKQSESKTEPKVEQTNNQPTTGNKKISQTPSPTPETQEAPPQQNEPIVEEYIEEDHEVRRIKQIDILEEFEDEPINDTIEKPEQLPDNVITPDDGFEYVDITRVPDERPTFPSLDSGIEEITLDDINDNKDKPEDLETIIPEGMENSEIQIISPDEVQDSQKEDEMTNNEVMIEIDSDKTDENGNLNNLYTDVSTDLNSTVTSETNNSEEIADFIINQMEQQGESYTEETHYVR